MFFCFGSHEVITLQYVHYPFAPCCAYVCKMVIYYAKYLICQMHALNNVKPNAPILIQWLGCYVGFLNLKLDGLWFYLCWIQWLLYKPTNFIFKTLSLFCLLPSKVLSLRQLVPNLITPNGYYRNTHKSFENSIFRLKANVNNSWSCFRIFHTNKSCFKH